MSKKRSKREESDFSDGSEFKVSKRRGKREESDYSDGSEFKRKRVAKSKAKPKGRAPARRKRGSDYESDESFKVTTRRPAAKKRAAAARGKRNRDRYCDTDEEEEEEETDETSEDEEDEDEKIARFNREFQEERRSTRVRRCVAETYCEKGAVSEVESGEEGEDGKRRKRRDSDDTFDEGDSDFGGARRRKGRVGESRRQATARPVKKPKK